MREEQVDEVVVERVEEKKEADDPLFTLHNAFMTFLFIIHMSSAWISFGYSVFLFANGLSFNEAFKTLTYMGILLVVFLLLSPLLCLYCICYSSFKAKTILIVHVSLVTLMFFINQIIQFVNFSTNIEPFDITAAPENEVDENLMTFLLATFNFCCANIDADDLLCSTNNETFPCIFDEDLFDEQDVSNQTCSVVGEDEREALCEERIENFAETYLNAWLQIMYALGITLTVLFAIMFSVNLVYLKLHEKVEEQNDFDEEEKKKEEELENKEKRNIVSELPETIPFASRASSRGSVLDAEIVS